MSSLQEYQMMLYPREDPLCADSSRTLTLRAMADQIQEAWPSIHEDCETILTRIYRGVPLRYEDDAGVFDMLLTYYGESTCIHISLRFAYSNPESVLIPFCSMIEWLITRYDMRAKTMRAGRMDIDEDFEVAETETAELVTPVFMPQMKILWDWWQEAGAKE